MEAKIPQNVIDLAHNEGYNSIHYVGMLDGAAAYSVSLVDMEGMPVPTGMPTFILLRGEDLTFVSGDEGLDLMLCL